MKIFYLSRETDCAVVLAEDLESAFKKAETRTGIKKEEWLSCEIFEQGMYGDVLWFN